MARRRGGVQVDIDTRKLDRLIREQPARLDRYLAGVVAQMHTEIVTSFGTSPPGKTYQLDNPTRTHVASQPGHPPNIDTGMLRAAMQWRKDRDLLYMIYDAAGYGGYGLTLEYGTTRVRPRPFVRPVFARWARKLGADMRTRGLFNV